MRIARIGAVFLTLTCASPAMAQANTWSIGLGAGYARQYTYRTVHYLDSDYKLTFDDALMASLSVNRRLRSVFSLQTALDYFEQEDRGNNLRAHFACVSVGVRTSFKKDAQAHPYIELMPALFRVKWYRDLEDYTSTSVRPGLVAGFGLAGPVSNRLGFDIGVRGHLSADWPDLPNIAGTEEYDGVKRVTLGGRVTLGL